MALRGGALRGLVTRGTRTRCLLAIGAAPVFTGILSMMTGRRSSSGARWLAATAAAITGCAMLVTSGHASGASAAGVALALLASLCYAVYAVTASHLITNGAGDRAVVGAIFGGAAVLLLPVLLTSPMSWVATGQGLAFATYLAVLTTALAYLLYARGLRTTAVTTATTMGLAEPAVAAVLGLAVRGERLTITGLAGLGVLAVGLVIAAWPARRPTAPPHLIARGASPRKAPPYRASHRRRAADEDRSGGRAAVIAAFAARGSGLTCPQSSTRRRGSPSGRRRGRGRPGAG